MKNSNILSGMAPLNQTALGLFVIAKITGLLGVTMGFLGQEYHTAGGWLLGLAMVSIFAAVLCGLLQSSKDKINFSKEDEEKQKARDMSSTLSRLQDEINVLEARREALKNLMIRRG